MDHPNDQKKKTSNSKGFKGDRLGDPPGDPQGDRSIITITRLFVLKKPLYRRGVARLPGQIYGVRLA